MISKAEMKIAVAEEFEQGFAEAKRAASDDALKWDGAKSSLKGAASAIDALLAHIAKDVKEDKVDEATAKYAQLYVRRAAEVVRSLKLKAEVHQERARGRTEALSMAENMAIRMAKSEEKKLGAPEAPFQPRQGPLNGNRGPGGLSKLEALRSQRMTPDGEVVSGELAVPQVQKKTKKTAKKKVTKKTTKKKATKKKARKKA